MSLTKNGGTLRTRRALSICRRRLLEQTRRAHDSQRELVEHRRHMASVAHDLRAPLQTVNVALALIAADAAPAMEKPIRLARASVARLGALLYDLLDFSALAHGEHVPLKKQKHRLSELASHALEDARLRFPERSFAADFAASGDWVDVDASRIAQVLDNLISNALLHGAAGTDVSLSVVCQADQLALRVSNVGAISDAARASLFEPLSHGQGALRRGSMGLGLYIVKQLVEAHGGRVELHGDAQSTTFSVLLPRAAEN
jgi:signal transduction histidine kinase